jgi:uncharacterized protein
MTSTTNNFAAPISVGDRIFALDALRGFALLGILIINIQAFAMIEAAYFNPLAYGDMSGLNGWVWKLSHIFGDLKFMALFSMMFGAGVVLMTGRMEAKGISPTKRYYRRTLGLILFGIMHAYLLWWGDILVWYGLCALFVFLFRRLAPKTLLAIGLVVVAVPSVLYLFFGLSLPMWPPEAYQEFALDWQPNTEMIAKELAAYRGGWLTQMEYRVPMSIAMHTFVFLIWGAWRAGGLMLLGMALFKWGVLTAERSRGFYYKIAAIGFVVGLPLIIFGVMQNFSHNWTVDFSRFHGYQFNYWGSLLVALGYVGVVSLACLSGRIKFLTERLAAVGRMALTNYLLQTIICTTIFYGHGFGLFGSVERIGQFLIVAAIWIFQLMISPIWLRHFRFGPFEWLWRSFTYLRLQPMRIRSNG